MLPELLTLPRRPFDPIDFDPADAAVLAERVFPFWSERYAVACEDAARGADAERTRELRELAAILRRVPARPARSFHEVLQAIWITQVALHQENNNLAPSFGRLDRYLAPLLQADLDAGRLSVQRAAELSPKVEQEQAVEVAAHLRELLAREHEVQAHSVVLVKARTIPKTSSGKIQRSTCMELLLEGKLEVKGRDAISRVPPGRWEPEVEGMEEPPPRWGGFLEDVERFDAAFFGISPREAQAMDPQQRLLLELSWEALDRAGVAPDGLVGQPVGTFFGLSTNDYALQLYRARGLAGIDAHTGIGNAASVAAGRVHQPPGSIRHLVLPEPLDVARMAERLRARGRAPRILPWSDWLHEIEDKPSCLEPLLPALAHLGDPAVRRRLGAPVQVSLGQEILPGFWDALPSTERMIDDWLDALLG